MMSMRMELRQGLRQELTIIQSLKLEQKMMQLKLDLNRISMEMHFEPKANCPNCSRKLSESEILKGFLPDPTDYTTECPRCGMRFMANLKNPLDTELIMLCPDQTIHRLPSLKGMSIREVIKNEPSVYYSAVHHFGSLSAALKEAGIRFDFNEDELWIGRIIGFLGVLPDSQIAKALSKPIHKIRKIRLDLGIKKYSKEELAIHFNLREEV